MTTTWAMAAQRLHPVPRPLRPPLPCPRRQLCATVPLLGHPRTVWPRPTPTATDMHMVQQRIRILVTAAAVAAVAFRRQPWRHLRAHSRRLPAAAAWTIGPCHIGPMQPQRLRLRLRLRLPRPLSPPPQSARRRCPCHRVPRRWRRQSCRQPPAVPIAWSPCWFHPLPTLWTSASSWQPPPSPWASPGLPLPLPPWTIFMAMPGRRWVGRPVNCRGRGRKTARAMPPRQRLRRHRRRHRRRRRCTHIRPRTPLPQLRQRLQLWLPRSPLSPRPLFPAATLTRTLNLTLTRTRTHTHVPR